MSRNIITKIFSVALPLLLSVPVLSFTNSSSVHLDFTHLVSPAKNDSTIDFPRSNQIYATTNVTTTSFRFPLDRSWSVTLGFGETTASGKHLGEDVYRPEGTRVHASANGTVKFAGTASGYGSAVVIEHYTSNEYVCTFYGHLSTKLKLQVSSGQEVSKGQLIGYIAYDDEDGGDWSPNIHFGIRKGPYSTRWVYHSYDPPGNIADWYDPSDFISSHEGQPQDKSLVSPSDGPYQGSVHWLQNNKLYWITEFIDNDSKRGATIDVMSSLPGWSWDKTNDFHSSLLESYSGWPDGAGKFVTTGSESNGLLLRKNVNTNTYLIQNGKKILLPNPAAIEQAGYSLADVLDVTERVLDLFPEANDGAQQVDKTSDVTVAPGQPFNIRIGMKNTGASVWTEQLKYRLGCHSGLELFPNSEPFSRIALASSENVTPGSTKYWSINGITAPSKLGIYTIAWQMIREDINWFGDSVYIQVKVSQRTNPPNLPSTPSGPTSGYIITPYNYSTSANDPDGDSVKYTFDWGDSTITETDYMSPGISGSKSHSWTKSGTYYIKAKATDTSSASSDWSSPLAVIISTPPNTPSKPSGPTSGYVETPCSYFSSATDPDGDQIKYTFSWGDSILSESNYVNSGISVSKFHSWAKPGTYYIKAKATDTSGASSEWSSWQAVTINPIPTSPLPAPILFAPANSTVTCNTSVTFEWKALNEANKYFLEVNSSPSWEEETRKYYESIGDTIKTITDFPTDGTVYYWRVKARNDVGWGPWSEIWSFINMKQPSAPTLSSPNDSTKVSGTSVTFTWTASEGASKYLLEVNTKPDWGRKTCKFFGDVGNIVTKTIAHFPNDCTKYYWRIRAGNDAGWGDPSSTWSFISTSPILASPIDNAAVPGTSVTFTWSASEGATKYLLEVNTTSDWDRDTSKFFGDVGNVTEYEDKDYPNDGTKYYWRVRAGNASGWISRSETQSFINTSAKIPAAPELSSPEDGVKVFGTSVALIWSKSTDANDYFLEVNSNPNWGKEGRIYYANIGDNITQVLTGLPNNGTTYYWRVRAGSVSGWSPWSESRKFINTSGLLAPKLALPEDGDEVPGTSITLSWNASLGATKYLLEINTDPEWGTATRKYNEIVGSSTATFARFLNDGTKYYWRVKAGNATGWSFWSEGWSFVNGTFTVPSVPTLVSPADGSRGLGTSVTFKWTASDGAYTYQLEVNNSPFWDKKTRKYREDTGNVVTYKVTGFANDNTKYYWRIRAHSAGGWSEWSESRSFINGPP